MKAAVYTRISLDRTGEGAGVERQRERITQACVARGWDIVGYYEDNDTSATNLKKRRPQFELMLRAVAAGEIDVIVSKHLDRLLRRTAELDRVLETCKAAGAYIATTDDGVDTSTDGGRTVARILASVAQGEVERKADRQKAANKQRAQQGKGWGTRAFGYTDDDNLEPKEAQAVKEAFTSVIHGASLFSIAAKWNAAGLLTAKGGNRWTGSGVRRVLLNSRYAGFRAYEGQHYPAVWPAIVTEDTWKAVQTILTKPSRRVNNSRVRVHLMSALAVCGVCRGRMSVGTSGEKKRIRTVYSCKNEGCRKIQRDLKKVDALVTDMVVGRLSMGDAAEVIVNRNCPDLDALRTEAAALRENRANAIKYTTNMVAKGLMSEAEAEQELQELQSRLDEIDVAMLDATAVSVFDGIIGAEDVRGAWDALSLDRKRAIIGRLFTVTINPTRRGRGWHPEDIGFEWRNTH